MANTLASLLVKIGADISGLEKGLDKAEKSTTKSAAQMQASIAKMSDGFGKAGTALTVGLTLPIVAFGAASVQAAMEGESAMAELNAVIKSTGSAAGVTAKQVTDYASAMQKVTKFDDEAIIKGQSMLLTFTKIGKDVFPAASTAMLNMAEKFGSIESASVQLGKALQDPVAGASALRRVGVALSDAQEEQIKSFMAVNDIASAQGIILKELEVEFGGLAEAAGATTAGKFIQFKNALGDLQEVVGAALLPNLISFTNTLRGLIDAFMAMPAPAQNAIIGFGVFLAALGPVLSVISTIITIAGAFAPGGAFAAVAAGAAGAGTAAAGASVGFGALGASILSVLWPLALVAAAVALLYFAWKYNFGGIQQTTKILVDQISLWFTDMGNTLWMITELFRIAWEGGVYMTLEITYQFIKGAFMGGLNNLWKLLKGIASFVVGYFTSGWMRATAAIQWVIDKMKELQSWWASMKPPAWFKSGTGAYPGLKNGAGATGGFESGMTLVGERGPELVSLPKGSYVHTASESKGMMGGGMTVNLNINGDMIASQRRELINASTEAAMVAFGQAIRGMA